MTTYYPPLNEGLADFASFTVTGLREIVSHSIPSLAKQRDLPVSWTLDNLPAFDEERIRSSSVCKQSFYCQGSLYASALYSLVIDKGYDANRIMERVLTSLESLHDVWEKSRESNSNFGYYSFINFFLEDTTTSEKEDFCEVFKYRFDEPDTAREIACQ